MTGQSLTAKQRDALKVIEDVLAESGVPPTYHELRKRLRLSLGAVQDRVEALVKKGALERRAGKARGLFPTGWDPAARVPVVGSAPAGVPIEAIEVPEGWLPVRLGKRRRESLFAVRANGDSMRDAAILSGDVCVAEKVAKPQLGDVVVALVDGKSTIKWLDRENGVTVLRPANPDFETRPIDTEDSEIQGRVVALWREVIPRVARPLGNGPPVGARKDNGIESNAGSRMSAPPPAHVKKR